MARPREVTAALTLLWLALGVSSIEFAIKLARLLGVLPFGGSELGLAVSQIVESVGLVVQALCIVSVGRGHGMIRWPLLVGVGWVASRVASGHLVWGREFLAPYHRLEPLGFVIRTGAVALLYLPRSNAWFRAMTAARRIHRRNPDAAAESVRASPSMPE